MSSAQAIQIEHVDDAVVISFEVSRLEHQTINLIKREAEATTTGVRLPALVVDLSKLEIASSVVMGALVELLQRQKKSGQRLMLCGLNDKIAGSFRVTRIDQIFEVCATRDEALERVRRRTL